MLSIFEYSLKREKAPNFSGTFSTKFCGLICKILLVIKSHL